MNEKRTERGGEKEKERERDKRERETEYIHNLCFIKDTTFFKFQVETFSEDQQHIQQLMGIPDPPQTPGERTINKHVSSGPSTNSLTKLYFSQMTPWERIRVYLAYYYDFQLFGYSPDDILFL